MKAAALECLKECGLVRKSVHESDENGKALILTAADDGWNESNLRLLKLAGADFNITDPVHGSTPLMFAAQNGHTGTVQALHSLGADLNFVNSDYDRYTALLFAVEEGKVSTVLALISLRSDINVITSRGESALDIARRKGFTAVHDLLLEQGALS